MYKDINDITFEGMLKTAFNEHIREQFDNEPTKEELLERYPIPKRELRTAKRLAKKVKYGKPPIVVYLQRACVITLVCLSVFYSVVVTTANEGGIELISKKAFLALEEKIEHVIDSLTINKTYDFGDYNSLSKLKENEDLNGALLPFGLDEKYSFSKIHFGDYGESKQVIIKIACNDELVGKIDIDTSVGDNLNKDKLVNIGRFDVIESHYNGGFDFDNVYQFEFIYEGNKYLIEASTYDILLEITESLE